MFSDAIPEAFRQPPVWVYGCDIEKTPFGSIITPMEESPSKSVRAAEISDRVLKNAYSTILVNMRFLDSALFRLSPVPSGAALSTNGRCLYYDPETLLNAYAKEPNSVNRNLLHVLLHCIFKHLFVGPDINALCWDLACDMAVEGVICDLGTACFDTEAAAERMQKLAPFKKNIQPFTAEKIYRYLLENIPPEEAGKLGAAFAADDHALWYFLSSEKIADTSDDALALSAPARRDLEKDWDSISRHVQLDLKTFSAKAGKRSASLLFQLRNVNRPRYDYGQFLKKFAVMGETLKVNDDEFDYIYYTYGLSLYENVPLIEPLEYKDEKRIREFVIAIDTSASVAGSLVKKFLQKTFEILSFEENFFKKINLYIIQCDAKIKDAAKITCKKDFEEYMDAVTISGVGGTDFRPVFEYVNSLVKAGEFSRLKGLIYFTDGYGTFPEKKPDYDTAFVFLRSEYDSPAVPPWAVKLVLEDI